MIISSGSVSKTRKAGVRLFILFMIGLVVAPMSPVQAGAAGEHARRLVDSAIGLAGESTIPSVIPSLKRRQDFSAERVEDPSERAERVAHIRLCPRRVLLYVGEEFTLSPLALDHDRQPVHGARMSWESSDPAVTAVTSAGELTALAPGRAMLTVQAGVKRAQAMVEVREGARPVLSDNDADREHAGDCDDPESTALNEGKPESVQVLGSAYGDEVRQGARNAVLRRGPEATRELSTASSSRTSTHRAISAASPESARGGVLASPFLVGDPIDGDSEDTFAADADSFANALGGGRFTAQDETEGGPAKTRRQLASYNYSFSAPVVGMGGRDIGVSLAMNYNGRLWNKDGSTMTFNYNKGWPAAGWSLGYGRIIKNYDNTALGNKTGVGSPNSSGNFLYLASDGSRVHFQASYNSALGTWEHSTNDGTFLHMDFQNNIKFPDGTVVKFGDRILLDHFRQPAQSIHFAFSLTPNLICDCDSRTYPRRASRIRGLDHLRVRQGHPCHPREFVGGVRCPVSGRADAR